MLGEDDDAAAVLSVLDRLTAELNTNRESLNSACQSADALGGGAELPNELVISTDIKETSSQLEAKAAECEYLKDSLELVANKLGTAASILRRVAVEECKQQLKIEQESSEELLHWQMATEQLETEVADLRVRQLAAHAELARGYATLQK